MRIASILLSILLIASILPGCCTKYKKIVEDQESLLSVNKTLISDLEGTQRELQKKLTENDALMKELQEKLTGDDAFVKELQKEVGSLEVTCLLLCLIPFCFLQALLISASKVLTL
jgi:Skp family chaperone for outer membrane proteins